MARAMHSQLANQHKNRQYRLHLHFQKFNTTEEAIQNRPSGIKAKECVKLCQKFASEEFQVFTSLILTMTEMVPWFLV